jgi:hypothetical protein
MPYQNGFRKLRLPPEGEEKGGEGRRREEKGGEGRRSGGEAEEKRRRSGEWGIVEERGNQRGNWWLAGCVTLTKLRTYSAVIFCTSGCSSTTW